LSYELSANKLESSLELSTLPPPQVMYHINCILAPAF